MNWIGAAQKLVAEPDRLVGSRVYRERWGESSRADIEIVTDHALIVIEHKLRHGSETETRFGRQTTRLADDVRFRANALGLNEVILLFVSPGTQIPDRRFYKVSCSTLADILASSTVGIETPDAVSIKGFLAYYKRML
jgi:hypothetical protein